ncbi:dimethyl sulfoxide reductase anchor subunit [Gordonibacter sp. An230]|uniref:dimethyl sulfoxide reductase anchor subunit n=1 Tax=Gordonibacter sp. An230 TaxID=1965592 RepID=UPI00111F4E51|nr:dimethyl sulfoxide reductase anchor subunit [Gordonibacter sp. An230]
MISEFPLFVFTTLAGLSAGAYVANAAFSVSGCGGMHGASAGEAGGFGGSDGAAEAARTGEGGASAVRPWLLPLTCLALLAVGLVFLPLHLGHPERMLIALTQPGAMIAQEAYWSAALGVVLLVDLVLAKAKGPAPCALRIVGAVAALGLMFVMANAYFVSAGIPAWASWQTFPLYFFGNLAMGAALVAVFENGLMGKGGFFVALVALAALALVAFALEAVHFAGVGADMALFVIAAALAAVAIVLVYLTKQGKLVLRAGAWATFACLLAAVACARYCFYAACVL